ncbi:hypothetical protein ALC57_00046, partial [Trachymyrmex cornetzi]
EGTCENCNKYDQLKIKHNFHFTKQIIILQLMLFSCDKKGISKITKYSIKSVPSDKVYIGEGLYRVCSAIYHHGNSVETGHYTNMLKVVKTNKSEWIYVSDQTVLRKQWPRGSKDAYIFFLEKLK